jgi:TolB-like protein/tetratricopeptide (TPR) repeat protein
VSLPEGGRLGPYEILGPLGAGGMGEVYLARDTRLGREVALKVLPSETAEDAELLSRFEREARAVAALNHPNVVTLHAIEEIEGRRVIVMERVTGRPLSAALEPRGLALLRVLDIAVPIADALAAAHERGVVHRDLKPANVMLSDEGRVKVLDFGLAKRVGPASGIGTEASTETHTADSAIVGTIPYMAPEQLRGQRVDARADIFSFGVMLYEMVSGGRPFRGDSRVDLMSSILREEPPPLESVRPDLPPPFVRLVARCLEKEPRQRIQSAMDLRHQLQDLADELRRGELSPRPAASGPPSPPPSPRGGRRRWRWGLVAAGLVAVAALAVWWRARLPRPSPEGRPQIHSVAVLPFENLMHDPSQDYFVDGLHDAVITELAKTGDLAVTSRNSVMRYKGRPVKMKDVARELGVDALVEGSVLRSGERVRITAQLIRGATDEHLWAESYDGDLGDVLTLLTDVSRGIAGEIHATLAASTAAPFPQPAVTPRVRPEAFEAYLRGREVMNDWSSPRVLVEALGHFERAVTLDPGLAPAWGGVATCAVVQAFFGVDVADNVARARDAARKALAIDPREGTGYSALGLVELYFDWDFEAARADLERAVALSPHDGLTRHSYADYLMVTGRPQESLEQTRLGRDANPSSPLLQLVVLFHATAAGRPEDVRREARLTLERFPKMAGMVHSFLGNLLWREGSYEKALGEYRQGMNPEAFRAFEEAYRRGGPAAARLALAKREREEAVKAARTVSHVDLAGLYAEAGQADAAFAQLDEAFERREPQLLHVVAAPAFDSLRGDPRYAALLRRIGIPAARGARGQVLK